MISAGRTKITHEGDEEHEGHEEVTIARRSLEILFIGSSCRDQKNATCLKIDCAHRVDLIIEDELLVELKSIDRLAPIHYTQLLTYLKLSGPRVFFMAFMSFMPFMRAFGVHALRHKRAGMVHSSAISLRSSSR
jgi:hypothetical protein